jgi:hypothetical protein
MLDEVVFILFLSYITVNWLHAEIPLFLCQNKEYRASQTSKRHRSTCNIEYFPVVS